MKKKRFTGISKEDKMLIKSREDMSARDFELKDVSLILF